MSDITCAKCCLPLDQCPCHRIPPTDDGMQRARAAFETWDVAELPVCDHAGGDYCHDCFVADGARHFAAYAEAEVQRADEEIDHYLADQREAARILKGKAHEADDVNGQLMHGQIIAVLTDCIVWLRARALHGGGDDR